MCFVIAKERDGHGCIALQTEHGKHMAAFKRGLNDAVRGKKIQLVTISRPDAYGEYAPYEFVNTEEEFKTRVLRMAKI